jgi:hypothetical protein
MVGGHIDMRYYKGGLSKLDKVALSADLDPHFYNFTPLWDYWAVGLGDCRAVLDDRMIKDGMQATYEYGDRLHSCLRFVGKKQPISGRFSGVPSTISGC